MDTTDSRTSTASNRRADDTSNNDDGASTGATREGKPAPFAQPLAVPRKTNFQPLIAVALLLTAGVISLRFNDAITPPLVMPVMLAIVSLTALLLAWWTWAHTILAAGRRRTIAIIALAAFIACGSLAAISWPRGRDVIAGRFGRTPPSGLVEPPKVVNGAGLRPVDLASVSAVDAPEFLGAGRRNAMVGGGLARDWKSHPPALRWRHPIGAGWSGISVVNGFAVTMEQRGEREWTVCYDLSTGQARWAHPNKTLFDESQAGPGPRATPTIAGGKVYALGATGILDCLNGATGDEMWSADTLHDAGADNVTWGKACSPLVVDDKVIVTGGRSGPTLLAYQRDTGKLIWTAHTSTPDDGSTYSSPTLATLAGVRQIVQVNAQSVSAHDPADGRLLWDYPWQNTEVRSAQPVIPGGDRVMASVGYGAGSIMLRIDRVADATLSAKMLWSNAYLKVQMSNIVVRDHYAFGLDEPQQELACIDLATGKKLWRGEPFGHGQPIGVDDLIIIQADNGDVAMVNTDPDSYEELGRFHALTGASWATPVLCGHTLVTRNGQEIACYDLP